MSLDVYLYDGTDEYTCPHCDTVKAKQKQVYWRNITHNLGKMANAAGLYDYLWRPDEHGITTAAQLIEPLKAGLEKLLAEPEKYKAFNPANGWGSYDGLVEFVREYLAACEEYPEAVVEVSR